MSSRTVELARRAVAIMAAEQASAVAARLGLEPAGERTWQGQPALGGAGSARLVADESGRPDCLTIAVDGDGRDALEGAFGPAAFVPRMPGADFERLGFRAGTGVLLYADLDDTTGRAVALTVCRH
jgi:hypothetical protein